MGPSACGRPFPRRQSRDKVQEADSGVATAAVPVFLGPCALARLFRQACRSFGGFSRPLPSFAFAVSSVERLCT